MPGIIRKVCDLLLSNTAGRRHALRKAKKELDLGHLDEAKAICLEMVDEAGNLPAQALHLLGLVSQRGKRFEQAIEYLLKAVEADPANSLLHRDLGGVYAEAGEHSRASASYEAALALRPADPSLHKALARAFLNTKQLEKAEQQFRRALSLDPGSAGLQSDLGKTLIDLGRLEEAEQLLRGALQADADDGNTHNRLGTLLRFKGEYENAEAHFREAIRLGADVGDAYNNLGAVLSEQGKPAEAEACFRSAVAHEPAHAMAWCNLGLILSNRALHEQTEECFRTAIQADPKYFYARIALVMNKLLEVYENEDEIARSRAAYQEALEDLCRWLPGDDQQVATAAESIGWVTPFHLAYQGKDDCELQATYGKFVCSLMAKRFPELASPPPMPALEAGKPLRVGVVSGFFFDHSVWKTLTRGWIENLDRSRFEIHGYYTRPVQDAATAAARLACSEFVEGLPFEVLARKIRSSALHVLIFPEIGMDPVTTKLATLRLAPIQCNSWGHPTASGMPTIDYYLSSEVMEPESADHLYTEKLIRLPNLSVHYRPPAYPVRTLTRGAVGLRDNSVVFLCAQSLFKYLPQYDALFPRTARQLNDSQFVFFASQHSRELTDKFLRRITRAFEKEGVDPASRVVMLPRVDNSTFQAVARISDIYLDSIGWSGCNTTLESMVCALPAITCKGSAMRGRHTYAFLKMMGLEELVAADLPSYVDLAVRLGGDHDWRRQIRGQIEARLPRLFGDMACVHALEDFLYRATNKNPETVDR